MNSPSINNVNSNSINFFAKLRDKRSSLTVNELMKFVNVTFREQCEKLEDMNGLSLIFQDFITKSTMEFAKNWEIEFCNNKNSYIEICEGLEGLATKALFPLIIEKIKEDLKLERLIKKYSFISLKHLGIDFNNIDEFDLATQIRSIIFNI
jgi:hypothetical protein